MTTQRYFAFVGDEGVIVRAAGSVDEFQTPSDWREVTDIHAHANERGIDELSRGKRMVFTRHDQSYRDLLKLFA